MKGRPPGAGCWVFDDDTFKATILQFRLLTGAARQMTGRKVQGHHGETALGQPGSRIGSLCSPLATANAPGPVPSPSIPEPTHLVAARFPRLSRYMGDTAFTDMIRGFVRSHLGSSTRIANSIQRLPRFLQTARPYSRHPELAEFATLELALAAVCEAPCSPKIALTDLARLDHATLARAVFAIQKPMNRLRFATNVTSLWSSMCCGVVPPKPERLPRAIDVIVWRQGRAARFRIVGEEELLVLEEAHNGMPFGDLCELIAAQGCPETAAARAATYLRGWIDAELICDVTIRPACAEAK